MLKVLGEGKKKLHSPTLIYLVGVQHKKEVGKVNLNPKTDVTGNSGNVDEIEKVKKALHV